jgi:hypothetical protein
MAALADAVASMAAASAAIVGLVPMDNYHPIEVHNKSEM